MVYEALNMWMNPVLLPQVSNREDLLLPISLFDDDSGQPILLDGTSLAGVTAFTSAAWTVKDGAITTTSATSITIPVYPIGAQLTPVTLTVGVGLGILQGDPVTISDTATGLNSMTGFVTSYAASTGVLVCQIGWTFQFEIRRGGPRNTGSGYVPWYDWGTPDDLGPILTASLANGYLTHTGVGQIQILIPESVFRTISDSQRQTFGIGTYSCGLTLTDSVNTRQAFIGTIPVFYGGVTT